jgi:hypothetical protein
MICDDDWVVQGEEQWRGGANSCNHGIIRPSPRGGIFDFSKVEVYEKEAQQC